VICSCETKEAEVTGRRGRPRRTSAGLRAQARVGDGLSSASRADGCPRVSERKLRSLPLEAGVTAAPWKSVVVVAEPTNRLVEMRNGRRRVRERQRDSRGLFTASWHGEASARSAAAKPGRCQRRGSNDDLYPLLPVLLPTRDNTNHYHRLITGITANIEIMRVYACARVHVRPRARARGRAGERASGRASVNECVRAHVCARTSQGAGSRRG